MATVLPQNITADYKPAPMGTHLGICYQVIDLGTQMTSFDGSEPTPKKKIVLTWELPNELMDNGKPFSVSKEYTLSSSPKSTLRQHLEAWRGKPFTDEELGNFDVANLLGKPCGVTIVHTPKRDGTGMNAKVQNVAGLMKGISVPPIANETMHFDLSNFDQSSFDKLSSWRQDTIKLSPEYAEAKGLSVEQVAEHEGISDDPEDELNF